ncbi:MAG: citrate lyase acyl carrier protein [Candidatus Competibacteraceae bacterium]|nr:citrate lyase acyl carrier protein [Candidatus Competibacteraceae bacterium]
MRINKKAQAGTMQSSDLIVFVEPADDLAIEIESTVQQQFGHLIEARVKQVLKRLSVEQCRIMVSDRGALDYAIDARVEAALRRAN